MNAVMFWKEYRQHRFIWLAVTILAVLLMPSISALMNQGSGWDASQDGHIHVALAWVRLGLAVTFGIVVGALLLAGETEDGTLVFLDGLAGRRGPIWRGKLAAGVILTLTLSAALEALAAILGFGHWETATDLSIISLNALAWGLLAGALCRTVLTAVLAGIGMMAAGWALLFFARSELLTWMVEVAISLLALGASWRTFCRDDVTRQPVRARSSNSPSRANFTSWGVLLRLVYRQGRWTFLGIMVSATVLGCITNLAPVILWPVGTLLLGLACGLAAFVSDQNGGKQFLATQRLPLGRFWAVKTICWGIVCCTATALTWYVATDLIWFALVVVTPDSFANASRYLEHAGEMSFWIDKWLLDNSRGQEFETVLLVGIWPLYGFCFGHFFGLLARRSIIAAFLAVVFAAPIAAAWVPSLLFGGVPIGWALIIPAILLVTSRLVARPWASDRLLTRRPFVGIAGAVALVLIVPGLFFWHRATEVPDVGEPFDVKAYVATLPPPEKNEAGSQLRRAAAAMVEHRKKVESKIGPPTEAIFEAEIPTSWDNYKILGDILTKGWPERDVEVSRWLDLLFEDGWVNDASRAARLPLGMPEDPRVAAVDDQNWKTEVSSYDMLRLFCARALQLQARGDSRGALNHLETALAISRQIKNPASLRLFLRAASSEVSALFAFDIWLQNVEADKELLRFALKILKRHQTTSPDILDTIKTQYLIDEGNSRPFAHRRDEEILNVAYQIPWEKERQRRLLNAATSGILHMGQEPVWKNPPQKPHDNRDDDRYASIADDVGLPLPEGPTAQLAAPQWGQLIRWNPRSLQIFRREDAMMIARSRRKLIFTQINIALSLYRADHGEDPEKLDDLVPTYLPELPVNPVDGKSFGYRNSKDRKN